MKFSAFFWTSFVSPRLRLKLNHLLARRNDVSKTIGIALVLNISLDNKQSHKEYG